MACIAVERHGGARHIVLDRAERRNALTPQMMDELAAALEAAGDDPEVACVVLRGAGPVFSAGIDLEVLPALADPALLSPIRRRFARAADLCETIPKPTVAEIHGACLGAGLELALACDLRVAAAGTALSLPETRIGAVPDVGGCTRLAALVGLGRAKELILTGATLDANAAREIGLVNRVAADGDLAQARDRLVAELLECSPRANGLAKRILDLAAKPGAAATHELELAGQFACTSDPRFQAGIEQATRRLDRAGSAA